MLPFDLLILSLANNIQPCPNTCLDTGKSNAINIAGHIIVWNLIISLPTTCILAGQYFWNNESSSLIYPNAVI